MQSKCQQHSLKTLHHHRISNSILIDGLNINIPVNIIYLVYSNHLMEHLHPADALEQLQNLHRVLTPGGIYVCITPNRLNGPHDISRSFTEDATGFHLREYTIGDMNEVFRQAGFSRISAYMGLKGKFCKLPLPIFKSIETLLTVVPRASRKMLANNLPLRLFMTNRIAVTK